MQDLHLHNTERKIETDQGNEQFKDSIWNAARSSRRK